jgi:hypothetical protein
MVLLEMVKSSANKFDSTSSMCLNMQSFSETRPNRQSDVNISFQRKICYAKLTSWVYEL